MPQIGYHFFLNLTLDGMGELICVPLTLALHNLPKGKSLGRSKPETNSSNEQAH